MSVRFLTRDFLDPADLAARVSAPARGAVATFLGTVRDHHQGRRVLGLSYSAYEPMAERVCSEIVADTERRWPVKVVVQHRLGELAVGDIAAAVVVAGDHRDESFAACRFVIEEVKRRVPIWKHEHYADGTSDWVDPTREQPSREESASR